MPGPGDGVRWFIKANNAPIAGPERSIARYEKIYLWLAAKVIFC